MVEEEKEAKTITTSTDFITYAQESKNRLKNGFAD